MCGHASFRNECAHCVSDCDSHPHPNNECYRDADSDCGTKSILRRADEGAKPFVLLSRLSDI